jgi:dolichyl-phosphate-mannose--protein O-mannosyl transferase
LICSSNVVFPRYFLPLLPFLILLSAYFVDTILSKGNLKCFRILFIILIFISIFYTGALTVSLLKSLEPQNSILASS